MVNSCARQFSENYKIKNARPHDTGRAIIELNKSTAATQAVPVAVSDPVVVSAVVR